MAGLWLLRKYFKEALYFLFDQLYLNLPYILQSFSEITVIGRRKTELPEDVTDINLEEQEKQGRVVQVQIGKKNCGRLQQETDIAFTFGNQLQFIKP